jgi:predicted nucleic acid-binding protein
VIYVDTGAFLARYLSRDQYHQKAGAFWKKIRKNQESCFTSNFVLDETFTLLGRWAGYDFASEKALPIASQLYSCATKKSKEYSHLIAILSAPDSNYARRKIVIRLLKIFSAANLTGHPECHVS